MDDVSLPLAEAVKRLFPGVVLAKHKEFKNGITTVVNTAWFRVLKVPPKEGWTRQRIQVRPEQMTLLWNCILIHGLIPSSRTVGEVVNEPDRRASFASWAGDLLIGRQSVAAVGLLAPELTAFLEGLRTSPLREERLPNPFSVLPQIALGGKIGLLQAPLAQSAVLAQGDGMMRAYFDGDLAKAARLAAAIEPECGVLMQYKHMILSEFDEVKRFSSAFAEMLE